MIWRLTVHHVKHQANRQTRLLTNQPGVLVSAPIDHEHPETQFVIVKLVEVLWVVYPALLYAYSEKK